VIIQGQEQKQDIGLAGSGNMRIDEFFDRTPNDDLPYDVIEDVHFHMIDDDAFYRKHYLPCMDQVKKTKDENTIKEIVSSMIDKCLNHYCLKYDMDQLPKDMLSDEEKSDLYTRVIEYDKNPPKELPDASQKPV
jgi:hypothetical protein